MKQSNVFVFQNVTRLIVVVASLILTFNALAESVNQIEIKPAPLSLNFLPGWKGAGAEYSHKLSDQLWFSFFYEQNKGNFTATPTSAQDVVLTGSEMLLVGPKLRYYFNQANSGYYFDAGLLYFNAQESYNNGQPLSYHIQTWLPAMAAGYQVNVSPQLTLRMGLQASFFVKSGTGRENLPETSNHPAMTKTYLDTLKKSSVFPGVDIGIGWRF